MKNTFGTALAVTLFGESHGPAIGVVLDGLAPGLPINEEFIRHQLTLRRPVGEIATARREADPYTLDSGCVDGKTTGTPLCIRIPNSDIRSADYGEMAAKARPGHADYTARCKYHGFADSRGGGHFSGRLTAALTAAGAIVLPALSRKGITVATHIRRCAGVDDRPFDNLAADAALLSDAAFPVLDTEAGVQMRQKILDARAVGDSVGGILETVVTGLPAGVGEPWFDTVEGCLSHALFGIPAVKGVEFGDGFALCDRRGSEANDPLRMNGTAVVTATNHNGGINGGITNGMPVIFRCAVKPTPTVSREQQTVNMDTLTDTTLTAAGRHDPCIVHRARVVVDSVTALTLYDLLAQRYGTDWFTA